MVEGVGYNPGAPGLDDGSKGVWWGENLHGVKVAPVRLSDPNHDGCDHLIIMADC